MNHTKRAIALLLILPALALISPKLGFCEISSCSSIRNIDADSALQEYEKGYAQYRKGNFSEAETHFLEALKYEPNLLKAHYWLGKLYREMGKLRDAIFHWEEVERLNKLIKFRREALKFRNNEYPAAGQTLRALKEQRDSEEAFDKGLHLLDKGHWDGAEVEFRKAISLFPGNKNYLRMLARLLWDKSEKQASIKVYRDLLSQRDTSIEDFIEGVDKIFEIEMDYLACPLFEKHQIRFANNPEFEKRKKRFIIEEKIDIVSAGKVLKKMKGQVVLDMGLSNGLSLSDEFSLTLRAFKAGHPIKDPNSGRILGRTEDKLSADLLITKVYKHSSWALIRKEFGPGVKAGDLIEIKETTR